MEKLKVLIVVIISMAIISCKGPAIEGFVKDGFGNPIEGVIIKVEGTQFLAKTDKNGEYSIEYVPGDIKLNISKFGFTDTVFNLKIATETTYPLDTAIIYEFPREKGIWLMDFSANQYQQLKIGRTLLHSWSTSEWFTSKCYEDYNVILTGESDNNSNYSILKHDPTQGYFTFIERDVNDFFLVRLNPTNSIQYEISSNEYEILSRTINNCGMGFAMGDFKDKIIFENTSYFPQGDKLGLRTVNLTKGGVYAFVHYVKRNSKPIPDGVFLFKVE